MGLSTLPVAGRLTVPLDQTLFSHPEEQGGLARIGHAHLLGWHQQGQTSGNTVAPGGPSGLEIQITICNHSPRKEARIRVLILNDATAFQNKRFK